MENRTIIVFFIISVLIAGGWIALVELANFPAFWSGVLSISVGAGIAYLDQRFK